MMTGTAENQNDFCPPLQQQQYIKKNNIILCMGDMVGLISVNNSKEDDECHLLKTNL